MVRMVLMEKMVPMGKMAMTEILALQNSYPTAVDTKLFAEKIRQE